jgi:hypothetical protein
MSQKQKVFLLIVILLAVFFRFYKIHEMPGGLFPDEAANGLDINSMQQGQLQPFYERGNGREALFFYMLWGSVELFGKGPWQHHIVSALVGVLSVVFCFLLTRRLFKPKVQQASWESEFDRTIKEGNTAEQKKIIAEEKRATNIALLASFLMAASSWHVVLSRTAFRANLIPLFAALTFYFLLCAWQTASKGRRFIFAFLCGASFALGFYTYIAYRIMVPILAMALLWPLLSTFKEKIFSETVKKYFVPALGFLAAFIIFIYPLGKYFYEHRDAFVGRSGQVSVFNQDLYLVDGKAVGHEPDLPIVLSVVVEVTKQSLLGFFAEGDLNWRHNISGFPLLSPLVSPFFGVGLALISFLGIWYFFAPVKRSGYWKYYLLTGWFWAMLLPVIATAEGIPHGLRAIGLIPPVFIISAWALYECAMLMVKYHKRLWSWCTTQVTGMSLSAFHQSPPVKPLGYKLVFFSMKMLVVVFCIGLIFQTYFLYFVYAYNSPENFYFFRSDLTKVSEYLKERCDKEHTYLVLDKFWLQTTDYLTSDRYGNFSDKCSVPYKTVNPDEAYKLVNLRPGDEIIFTQSTAFDAIKFKQYHPHANLSLEHRNKFGQVMMAVYEINN